MAEKRMFAQTIIDSDAFLQMPQSSQLLYFHMGMRADDDGFVNNPRSIMAMIGSKDDDMKVLISKKFIIPFESGVVVIKHWKIHNYIAKDRYTETKYKDLKASLSLDENNSYTFGPTNYTPTDTKKPLTSARQKRLDAKNNSDLPYSFDYKMRNAFVGEKCPMCGITMGATEFSDTKFTPTIQHNVPISKGGKHELSNISVVCRSCNSTVQDNETPPYNTEKVIDIWSRIGNGSGMYTQIREDKIREEKNIYTADKPQKFEPPTIEEVREYCQQRGNGIDAESFVAFYESKGWMIGKNKMKSWKAAVITWERSRNDKPQQQKESDYSGYK